MALSLGAAGKPNDADAAKPAHLRYDLGVPFEELDLSKFAFFSSVAFFGESLVYYPLDVIRTRLQVAREVRRPLE
jgi:hypothetical protein